jgi:hypothetical protein
VRSIDYGRGPTDVADSSAPLPESSAMVASLKNDLTILTSPTLIRSESGKR